MGILSCHEQQHASEIVQFDETKFHFLHEQSVGVIAHVSERNIHPHSFDQ